MKNNLFLVATVLKHSTKHIYKTLILAFILYILTYPGTSWIRSLLSKFVGRIDGGAVFQIFRPEMPWFLYLIYLLLVLVIVYLLEPGLLLNIPPRENQEFLYPKTYLNGLYQQNFKSFLVHMVIMGILIYRLFFIMPNRFIL